MATVKCQQCQSQMNPTSKVDKNMTLQLLGVVLFLLSLPLLIIVPIGTVAGIILMIVEARLGYKRINVWACPACGYFFERGDGFAPSRAPQKPDTSGIFNCTGCGRLTDASFEKCPSCGEPTR